MSCHLFGSPTATLQFYRKHVKTKKLRKMHIRITTYVCQLPRVFVFKFAPVSNNDARNKNVERRRKWKGRIEISMLEKWKKPEYEKEVKRTSAGNGQKEERKKERKKRRARRRRGRVLALLARRMLGNFS